MNNKRATVSAGTDNNGKKKKEMPMTTAELFNRICNVLKDKGLMPDILDYGLETHQPAPVMTYEFDLKNSLQYGGNEGIYLTFWIECSEKGEKKHYGLGTFKTLREDKEAMHIMAGLLADFIVEEYEYVNSHLDDFTWTGVDVYAFDEKGVKANCGYTCGSMETAVKRKNELLRKYPHVVIRDNATRKVRDYLWAEK